MPSISIYVLIPGKDLRIIVSFHALDSDMYKVFVVVGQEPGCLLRLDSEVLRQTKENELKCRLGLPEVLRVGKVVKRCNALVHFDLSDIGAAEVYRELGLLILSCDVGGERVKKLTLLLHAYMEIPM